MTEIQDTKQNDSLNYKLEDACQDIGWGWAGAEIHEAAEILKAARALEQKGQTDIWGRVVDLVRSQSWSHSPQYLLECTMRYAEGVQRGIFIDLDGKSGPERNSSYLLGVVEKLKKLVPIK